MPSEKVAAEEVEGRLLLRPLLLEREGDCQEDEGGHREANIEDRVPAVVFTEPAADAWAAADAEQHAYRRSQADPGVARRRQHIEQKRRRQRNEWAARGPLDDPGERELDGSRRKRSEHEADREDGEGNLIDRLSAVARCEPARHRHDNDARRNIRGEDPTDLVVGHRQRALDMRQGRIRDRDIEPLHVSRH